MRLSKIFAITLLLILIKTINIQATTWIVDQQGNGDFVTITEAVNNSSDGDTIFINAGIYVERLILNSNIHFIGVNHNSVIWTYTYNNDYIVELRTSASFKEITFQNGYPQIEPNLDRTIQIKNCVFRNSSRGIYTHAGKAIVQNSVFKNLGTGINGSDTYTRIYIQNSIFCDNICAINGSNICDVKNCIFVNCSSTSSNIYDETITYSCFYNSENNSGYGNIFDDPLLRGIENRDFRLQSGSPCIDAGHPSLSYNDPDGSRNDIGVFGGPCGWLSKGPIITNIQIYPEKVPMGETIQIQATATVETIE